MNQIIKQPQTVPQYRKFFIQEGISPLEIKAKYGDLRLKATWEKACSEYTYARLPLIVAIAQTERPQPKPQPKPQPRSKLPATVNVASVLAQLEKSSSTLDLFSDGNISPVAKNIKKVLCEELVINLGVSNFRHPGLRPIYCQTYRLTSGYRGSGRKVAIVSPVPIFNNVAFGKYCDRDNFVNICRE